MSRPVAISSCAAIACAVLAAGCASLPAGVSGDLPFPGEDVAPLTIEMTMLVESTPIEPIEPLMLAPPLLPAPMTAPVSSAATPAPTAAPSAGPTGSATGAPAENVVAAVASNALPPLPLLPLDDLAALSLIADLQRYNGLGADEARRELTAATNALSRERSDANRVRLAVLYTLVRGNPQDDQRAMQLLDNVARSPGGPTPVKALAAVLYVQVSDRVRFVREEQVKANDAIQKLEALRAMERSLLRERVRSGGGGDGGGGGGGGGGGSGGR